MSILILHILSKSNDLTIWEFAKKNELIILTHDSYFYDIAILNPKYAIGFVMRL